MYFQAGLPKVLYKLMTSLDSAENKQLLTDIGKNLYNIVWNPHVLS